MKRRLTVDHVQSRADLDKLVRGEHQLYLSLSRTFDTRERLWGVWDMRRSGSCPSSALFVAGIQAPWPRGSGSAFLIRCSISITCEIRIKAAHSTPSHGPVSRRAVAPFRSGIDR